MRGTPPALIALSPGTLRVDQLAAFERVLKAALEGGLRGVVLREPGLTDATYLELGRRVRSALARVSGGWFAVHDRAYLALELDADAVHVGFRSLGPAQLRDWLPRDVAIGLSTHAGDDVAAWDAADYLFHGPVFATPSKTHARAPVGFEGLRRAVASARAPVWALGGLQPGHAREVAASGAHGLAVLGGILARPDAAERARAYVAAWLAR